MKIISIDMEFIRLDILLKLAGVVETGGHAKLAVQNGEILVNGGVYTMRGKKMHGGDRAEYQGNIYEAKILRLSAGFHFYTTAICVRRSFSLAHA